MGSRAQRNENTTPSVLIAEPVQAKQPTASRDASNSNADTHHTSSHGVDGGPVYILPQLLRLEFGTERPTLDKYNSLVQNARRDEVLEYDTLPPQPLAASAEGGNRGFQRDKISFFPLSSHLPAFLTTEKKAWKGMRHPGKHVGKTKSQGCCCCIFVVTRFNAKLGNDKREESGREERLDFTLSSAFPYANKSSVLRQLVCCWWWSFCGSCN